MSCTRKTKAFETKTIHIETCNAKELKELEDSCILALQQIENKLNIATKECDIYSLNGNLLINNRFGMAMNISKIANAFGLSVKEIQCNLRGKTYLISTDLVNVLEQIGSNYNFGGAIANKDLTDEIAEIIASNSNKLSVNEKVLDMVKNIRYNGSYTATVTREVTITERDSLVLEKEFGEWHGSEGVEEKLKAFAKRFQDTINKNNENLKNGTVELLKERAKMMGYHIEEKAQGKQTQLILVRYE